jgi:hypothetical protein
MEKTCSRCQTSKNLDNYYKHKLGKFGVRSECQTCCKILKQEYLKNNKEKANKSSRDYNNRNKDRLYALQKEYKKTPKGRFNELIKGAKKRNLPVEITFEDYSILIKQNCYYCNSNLPKTGSCVDRIENSKGYLNGNCVACCPNCNRAKMSLSLENFTNHIEKIYINFIQKGNYK